MKTSWLAGAAVAALTFASAAQAETNVSIGFSGWTGFASADAGRGRQASSRRTASTSTLKKIPQASRHLALASGAIQCAATTVETHVIIWNAATA
jgi:NitT/TauT family transport system substrate-binding protein